MLTNSDEVNLNLENIDKKVDKLNAGSLGEIKGVTTHASAEVKNVQHKQKTR